MNQMVTISYKDINGIWTMPKIARTTKAARKDSKYMMLRVSRLKTKAESTEKGEGEEKTYAGGGIRPRDADSGRGRRGKASTASVCWRICRTSRIWMRMWPKC